MGHHPSPILHQFFTNSLPILYQFFAQSSPILHPVLTNSSPSPHQFFTQSSPSRALIVWSKNQYQWVGLGLKIRSRKSRAAPQTMALSARLKSGHMWLPM